MEAAVLLFLGIVISLFALFLLVYSISEGEVEGVLLVLILVLLATVCFIGADGAMKRNNERNTVTDVYSDSIIVKKANGDKKTIKETYDRSVDVGDTVDGYGKIINIYEPTPDPTEATASVSASEPAEVAISTTATTAAPTEDLTVGYLVTERFDNFIVVKDFNGGKPLPIEATTENNLSDVNVGDIVNIRGQILVDGSALESALSSTNLADETSASSSS